MLAEWAADTIFVGDAPGELPSEGIVVSELAVAAELARRSYWCRGVGNASGAAGCPSTSSPSSGRRGSACRCWRVNSECYCDPASRLEKACSESVSVGGPEVWPVPFRVSDHHREHA